MLSFKPTLIPAPLGLGQMVRVCAAICMAYGASMAAFAAQPAATLPTGGQVAAGQAAIGQSGNTLTVNQTSQRAVLNWNTFNVGSNAAVEFKQPNSQAVVLNRVTSATPSQIDGAIHANGRVIISNTNGVTFGKGAEVNAGAVVATTMNQSDADFMSGSNTFEGNGTGKVVNKGKINITDPQGYVALLAPEVRNQGVILATVSSHNAVVVGAAEKLTLNFKDSNLIGITVDKAAVNALIQNKRAIEVAGGVIVLATGSANQLIRSVIQNTGQISANSMTSHGGVVELVAGTVNNNGRITANAQGVGNGGTVKVMADNVALGTKSDIQVNAGTHGNGGTVQIWANQQAAVAGQISATGGSVSGSGGSIGTSAKLAVTFDPQFKVDTSAKNGRFGQWVIDPLELTIDANAASLISAALRNTNVTLDATGSACVGSLANCTTSILPLVNFLAGANIYSDNASTTLRVLAAGGTVNVNNNIDAGQVYIEAANISVKGNIGSTGGANGGIVLLGGQINILGGLGSNGQGTNATNSATTIGNNRRRLGANAGLAADDSSYNSNGGSILISATGDVVIDADATVTANGLAGGQIAIVSQLGTVIHRGVVDAVGTANQGGNIKFEADSITLEASSQINAVGALGGGTVLVGGDWQGGGTVRQATLVSMRNGASIDASAIQKGHGGKVVLWSDVHSANSITSVSGSIYAKGGANGGDGGQVETSGHLLKVDGIAVNTSAFGNAGNWLLDPDHIVINTGGSSYTNTSGTITSNGCTLVGAVCSSYIDHQIIESALSSGNVTIQTADGNITVQSDGTITLNSSITNSLTLRSAGNSGGNITFDYQASAAINAPGLALVLNAATAVSVNAPINTKSVTISAGTLRMGAGGSFASSTGLVMSGTANFDLNGINTTVASLTGVSTNNIYNSATGTTSVLTVSGGATTYAGLIKDKLTTGGTAGLTLNGGVLTLSGDSTYTGATNINGGTLKLSSGSLFKCGASSLGCGAGDTLITLKSSPLGISSISIAAGGTLDINGSSSASNAFIAPITMSGVDGTSQAYLINSSTTNTSVYGRITLANTSTTGLVANIFAQASGGTLTIGAVASGGVIVDATSSTNYAGIQVGARINSVDYMGTVSFSAQNTYAGGTTVAYGTYKFTGAYNAIFRCGSAAISCTTSGSTNLYSGQLGIGTVTVNGGGTLDLAAAGTNYNGAGYFNNPLIMAGTNTASAYITNSDNRNNAGVYGSVTIANALQANTRANIFSGIATATTIIGGVISDASLVSNYGGVQIGDASNLGSVYLSNANTYSGGTTIAYGKLVLSSDYVAVSNVITTSPVGKGDITINPGATLNVNGHDIGVSGASNNPTITMAGSGIGANQAQLINASTNTYKIIYASIVLSNVSPVNAVTNVIAQASGATLTISGVISDGVGANYSGLQFGSSTYTGTVVAASNSTYAGGTTVAYGTLQLANTGTLATSAKFYCGGSQLCDATHSTISSGSFGVGNITINGGATFDLNGTGSSATAGYFYNPIVMNGSNASSQALLVNSSITSNANVYGAISLANAAAANVFTNAFGQKSGAYTLNINGIISDIAGVTTNSGLQIGVTASYTGTVALLNLNNYIGVTQVTAGTLSVNNLANGGQASSIGTSSSDASNLIFKGGMFAYTGATASTDRLFTLSATGAGALTISISSAGALSFLNAGPIVNNATVSNTISFVNSGVTKSVFSPVLPDPTTGALSVIVSTGRWELAGMNTYSGVTSTGTGSLYVSVLANGGSNSNIGKSTNLAANLKIGSGGSFYYTGADVTTDRLFTLLGNVTIDASGSGVLHFSNTGNISVANSSYTLTLQGSGNAILDSTVPNGSSGSTSVTKAGTGTWTLAGANTYTGGTSISQGVLQFGTNTYFYCGGSQVCNASNTTISSGPLGTGSVTINNSSYLDLNGNGASESYGLFYNAINLSGITGGYAYLINSNPTVSAASYGLITLIKQSNAAGNWANTEVFAQAAGSATLKIAGVIKDASSGTSVSGLVVGAATINSVSYSGTVIFSGINTYSNPSSAYQTVINYGTLQIAADSNLGGVWTAAYNSIQLLNGGTLLVSGQSGAVSLDAKRNINLGTGGGTIANHSSTYAVTLSSVISGITQLTIGSTDNLGTIVLSGSAVTASGSYTGPTSVTSGALLDLKLDSTNTTTTASFNSTYTGAGSIIVEPLTSGTITLGGTGSTLNLASALFTGTTGTGRKFADGFANITIGSSSAGNLSVAANATAAFSDSVTLLSGANITINSGASVRSSQADGNLVVAATSDFLNLAGSSALQTTDSGGADRWIVYSASPSSANFGGVTSTLVSGNKAYWGNTYATLAPSSVGAGNRYVFNTAGTVTVTTTNATMTYGVPIDLSSNYTVSNASMNAAPTGTPYISNVVSDLFATVPTIASTGNTATAAVGQYDITASGAVAATGIGTISYTNTGKLTLNPAVITLSVVGSKTYDGTAIFDARPTNTNVTVSGLVNADKLATVTANSPDVSANGSNYFKSFTMGAGTASNYTLVSGYDASNNKATINPATLTVTANATNMTYGATALPGLTYSNGALVDGNNFTGNLTSVAPVHNSGSGTFTANSGAVYPITIGTLSAGNNYTISYTGANLTMVQAPLTITAVAKSMTYGAGSLPNLTYTNSTLANGDASSVLTGALSTTATAYNGTAGSASNAGTYPIGQNSISAGPNYNISYVGANVTVDKAILSVTGSSPNMVYGATALPSLSYGYSGYQNGDGSAAGLTGAPSVSTTASVYNAGAGTFTGNAGTTYTVIPSVSGMTSTNYTFAPVNGSLLMVAAPFTVTATAANMTYGATAPPTLTYTTSALVNGNSNSVLSGSLAASIPIYAAGISTTGDAGSTYPINQGTLSAGNNYTITYQPANVTVTKAVLTVAGNSPNMTYGATSLPTLSYAYNGYVNGDSSAAGLSGTPTVSTAAPVYIAGSSVTGNAGATYAVAPNVSGLTSTNYTFAASNGTLTIVAAPLSVTGTKVYNANGGFVYSQMSVSGAQNGEALALTAGSATTSSANVATYAGTSLSSLAIGVTGGNASASNYSLPSSGSLSITPATLTYAATSTNSIYGSQPSVNAGAVTGFAGSDTQANATSGTLLFSTLANQVSNVGNYAITGSGLTANNGNYTFAQAAGNAAALTINPATLTYTATPTTSVYGATPSVNAGTVTGFVNGQDQSTSTTGTLTFATVAGSTSNVGSYAINGSGLTANLGNYTFVQAGGNATGLTINPANLTYTATPTSNLYGRTPSVNAGTVTGFVNGQDQSTATTGTLLFGTTATAATNIGSYAINGSGLTANHGNYAFVQAAGNATALTINPAPLTLTGTKVYDGNGNFTYAQMSLGGAQNSETVALTAGSATASGVSIGSYSSTTLNGATISVLGGNASSSNYTLPVSGTFGITGRSITITADAQSTTYGSELNLGTSAFTLSGALAAGDSVTAVTLQYNGNAVVPPTTNAGTYANGIVASGATGTGAFNATNYSITYVPASLLVNKATLTVTGSSPSMSYGAATLPTLSYSYSGFQNGETSVAGLTGTPTVSTTAPVYLAGTSVTGNAGATYAVTPSVSGVSSTNYNFVPADGTLTMTKATVAVTADGKNMTYGASSLPNLTYTYSGLANGNTSAVFSGALSTTATAYNGTAGSASNVGNYPISKNTVSAGSNYDITYTGANVTVDKATLTVTGGSTNMAYGATSLPSLSYAYSGYANGDAIAAGLSGTPTVSTTAPVYLAGTSVTGNAGATYAVTPSATGVTSTNYTFATSNGTLTMVAAPLTVTATAVNMTYGASTLPTLNYTTGSLLNGDTNAVLSGALASAAPVYAAGTSVTGHAGATYAITGGTVSAGSNYTISYTGAIITMTKANLTVTGNNPSMVYGATSLPSLSYAYSGYANGDSSAAGLSGTPTVSTTAPVYLAGTSVTGNAGATYAVTPSVSGVSSTNYNFVPADGALTMTKATVAVTADGKNMTYGASSLPNLTYTYSGLANGNTSAVFSGALSTTATAYNGTAGSASNVGTYPISKNTVSAGSNYDITYTGANVTVGKATVTFSGSAQFVSYNASTQTASNTYVLTGVSSTDNTAVGISVTPATGFNANRYYDSNAQLTGLASGNYQLASTGNSYGILVINPSNVTYRGSVSNTTYNANAQSASNTYTLGGVYVVDLGKVSVTATSATGTNAGTYYDSNAMLSLTGSATGNYQLSSSNNQYGSLIIAKAPLTFTVTPSLSGNVYNGSAYTSAYTSTLLGSDTATVTGLATGINAGTYTSNLQVSGASLANYNTPVRINASLVIDQKPLTINGQTAVNKVYTGTTAAALDSNNASLVGVVSGDAVTLDASNAFGTFASVNVNNGIAVTVAGNALSGVKAVNYSLSQPTGLTANITPAPLVVTANDDAKFVTQNDAAGFKGVSYSGFVAGQGASDLTGSLVITRSNSSQNNAGPYAGVLVPSGLISTNYSISYVNGDYNIVPAETLLISSPNTTVTYGAGISLSPLTVKYLTGGSVLKTLTQTAATGNTFTYSDDVGGSATFTLAGIGNSSTSGKLVVGNYDITGLNFSKVNNNFNSTPVYTGVLTVAQQSVSASTSTVSKVYDGTTAMNGLSLALSNVVTNDVVTVGGVGAFAQVNKGTNINYSVSNLTLTGADSGNYYLSGGNSFSGSNGEITPAVLTYTATSASSVYGNTPSVNAGSVGGFVTGDNLANATTGNMLFSTTATSSSNVGSYAINGSGLTANHGNYTLAQAPGNAIALAITPAGLTVSGTKVYDANGNFGFTQMSVSGAKNSETISLTAGSATASAADVAAYAGTSLSNLAIGVTSGNASAANYTLPSSGSMSITSRAVTLTANAQSTTHGAALSLGTNGYSVSSGSLASGDAISAVTLLYNGNATVPSTTGAGTYTNGIVTSTASGTGGFNTTNYAITYAPADLTVNQKTITLSANAQSTTYGTALSLGTSAYTLTSGALVNGDTISAVTLQYNGNATVPSATSAGTYTNGIVASAATGTGGFNTTNYAITYAPADLTVNQKAITLSANAKSATYGTALSLGTSAYTLTSGALMNGDTISAVTLQYNGNATVPATTNAATYANGIVASAATGTGGFNTTNYAITYAPADLTVNQKAVTITNNVSSTTYNATSTYASLVTTAGYSATALAGSDAIASVTQNMTVSGNAVSGIAQAGSFVATPSAAVLSTGNVNNYAFTYVPSTNTVAKANVSFTATASLTGNVYNGSAYSGTYTSTLLGSDTAAVTGLATGTNAGTYTSNLQVSGAAMANYNTPVITNASLVIDQKPLTISGQTAVNKVYTASTAAALDSSNASLVGVVSGDAVTLDAGNAFGTFASANVANGIAVTVAGNALSGVKAANYSLSQPTGLTANITPAPLVVTANDDAKFVTQNDAAGFKGVSYSGFVAGQGAADLGGTLAITRSNSSQNNAGPYAGVLVPSGLTSTNYSIRFANGDYTIVPAQTLLISTPNTSVAYGAGISLSPLSVQYLDGANVLKTLTQTSATGNTFTYSDDVGGSATFTLAGIGNSSTSGKLVVGNYDITGLSFSKVSNNFNNPPVYTGVLTVSQQSVVASTSTVSKVYDGTTAMNGLSLALSNVVTNDVVTVGGVGAFAQANKGTNINYSVSNLTLTGADSGNYYLSGGNSFNGTNGEITVAPLTVVGATTNTTYTGLLQTNAAATVTGLKGSDAFTVTGYASATNASATPYADNLVATPTVGTTASNYSITYTNGALNIAKAPLTVTATSLTKPYDGQLYSGGNGVTYSGFVNNETLAVLGGTLSYTGTSQGANNAGTYVLTPAGLSSNNYAFNYVSGSLTIQPVVVAPEPTYWPVQGTLTGSVAKAYDGTVSASLLPSNYVLTGFISGQGATVLKTQGVYDNANVGAGKLVTVSLQASDFQATGTTNLANYILPTSISGRVGVISKATVSVTADKLSKPFMGVDPALTYTVSGLAGRDVNAQVLTGGPSRTPGEALGTYSVSVGSLAVSSNYELAFTPGSLQVVPGVLSSASSVFPFERKAHMGVVNTSTPVLLPEVSCLKPSLLRNDCAQSISLQSL